jgi:hypothetical protein
MRPVDIEAWVLRVADQVAKGEHSEDSRVELKARWPDAKSAARRIAAHANAARGAEVLWIIGLDEKAGPRDPGQIEVSDWFATVRQQFDSVYPELQDLNIRLGDHTVVAMVFSTDRAPYVIRNPSYGKEGGEKVELEVPWREGRSTRTARRQELLRMLAPLMVVPEIEGLSCELSLREEWNDDATQVHRWHLNGSIYLLPTGRDQIVIPFHRCKVRLAISPNQVIEEWKEFGLNAPRKIGRIARRQLSAFDDSKTIESTSAELIVNGPGRVEFFVGVAATALDLPPPGNVAASLYLHAVGASVPSVWSCVLEPTPATNGARAKWKLGSTAA